MKKAMLVRTGLTASVALLAGLSLAGCSLLGGGNADRGDDGQVTETANDSVFSMKVGDCLNEPQGTEVSDVELVPCSQPHDYEVYDETTLPEGDYPSDLDAQAETFCVDAFKGFVGVDHSESTLDVTWFTPTEEGWKQEDDRLIQCMVFDPSGQTTGSLSGANK